MFVRFKTTPEELQKAGISPCCCVGTVILLNMALGGVTLHYVLGTVFGVNIPWWADAVGGLFLGQFTVPAALVCWIATLAGATTPFVAYLKG